MIELLKPNFEFEDERGKLTQLVRDGFSQFNIIFSKAGVLRGNHFHKINREAFYVISGDFELTAQKGEKDTPNALFVGFALLASMYDIGVECSTGEKDIFIPE